MPKASPYGWDWEFGAGLFEFYVVDVVVGQEAVGVVELLAVDCYVVECDAAHAVLFVVTHYQRRVLAVAVVADVAEGDVADAVSGGFVVLGVEKHFQAEEAAFLDALDADVLEQHVAHGVLVATVDVKASLVQGVVLVTLEYVDIADGHVFEHFTFGRFVIAVSAHVDGVGYIGS